jgi:hypothetical protein
LISLVINERALAHVPMPAKGGDLFLPPLNHTQKFPYPRNDFTIKTNNSNSKLNSKTNLKHNIKKKQ